MAGGQTWSITINASSPYFVADVYGTDPGDPLQAENNDVISWNNQTDDEHQPYQTDENYNPTGPALCDVIAAYQSSFPGFVPNGYTATTTIYYYCQKHTDEHGQIVVNV